MDYISELKGCLDSEGRLTHYPAKRKKKLLALAYLAEKIPAGVSYNEREFSALLNSLHTFGDPATLRRELYDFFFVDRTENGSSYTLTEEQLPIEQLLEKYCT